MYITKPCSWVQNRLVDRREVSIVLFEFRGVQAADIPPATIYVVLDEEVIGRIVKTQNALELVAHVQTDYEDICVQNILVPKLMLHVDPEDKYTGDGFVWFAGHIDHPDRVLPKISREGS